MRPGRPGSGWPGRLTAAGIRCEVAAPSKLQRPAGDRVKTDARDALQLARLLRMDELTAVTVPSVEQEAARDLVRAREDCRGDLMRARHRLSKLLLRHGIVYAGGRRLDRHARRLAAARSALTLLTGGDPAGVRRRYETVLADQRPPGPAGRGDRGRWPPTASSPRSCAGWAACAGSPP